LDTLHSSAKHSSACRAGRSVPGHAAGLAPAEYMGSGPPLGADGPPHSRLQHCHSGCRRGTFGRWQRGGKLLGSSAATVGRLTASTSLALDRRTPDHRHESAVACGASFFEFRITAAPRRSTKLCFFGCCIAVAGAASCSRSGLSADGAVCWSARCLRPHPFEPARFQRARPSRKRRPSDR